MTDRDPAFIWETAALRAAPQRIAENEVDSAASGDDPKRWVTLREANRATGIPVETLRKWARRSTIPSYLSPTAAGTNIRMVELGGVTQRAADLGRAIAPERAQSQPAPETVTTQPSPEAATTPSPESATTPLPDAPIEAAAPAGTMIVPIDAWNKMLNQLGNLHEAGQQLAIVTERAAKAETEAKFLRERLAELRREPIEPSSPASVADSFAEPAPLPTTEPSPDPPEKIWQYLVRRVRDR
jgi:hypothetical protein